MNNAFSPPRFPDWSPTRLQLVVLVLWVTVIAPAAGMSPSAPGESPGMPGESPGTPGESPGRDQIHRWINDWEASSFATRQRATQQLEAAGRDAYELLAQAAMERPREVTVRALAILERGLRQPDAAVAGAARKSVERIATSGSAAPARAAQELLRDVDRPAAALARAAAGNGLPPGVVPLANGRGFAIPRAPFNLPPGAPGGWPIGPIPPPKDAAHGIPANGNRRDALRQAQLQQVLQSLDDSINRTQRIIGQTADPVRRAQLQRQLEQWQQMRWQLQRASLMR